MSVGAAPDLREERDRFVAFAFAAADLLVQLDGRQCVVFASGAAQSLLGLPAATLPGRNFADFVDGTDKIYFRRLLEGLRQRGRIEAATLLLHRADGQRVRVMAGGCCFTDRSDDFFLSFTHMIATAPATEAGRDPETRLLSPKIFTEVAAQLAQAPDDGAGNQMVMLHVGGLAALEHG